MFSNKNFQISQQHNHIYLINIKIEKLGNQFFDLYLELQGFVI